MNREIATNLESRIVDYGNRHHRRLSYRLADVEALPEPSSVVWLLHIHSVVWLLHTHSVVWLLHTQWIVYLEPLWLVLHSHPDCAPVLHNHRHCAPVLHNHQHCALALHIHPIYLLVSGLPSVQSAAWVAVREPALHHPTCNQQLKQAPKAHHRCCLVWVQGQVLSDSQNQNASSMAVSVRSAAVIGSCLAESEQRLNVNSVAENLRTKQLWLPWSGSREQATAALRSLAREEGEGPT